MLGSFPVFNSVPRSRVVTFEMLLVIVYLNPGQNIFLDTSPRLEQDTIQKLRNTEVRPIVFRDFCFHSLAATECS